MKRNASICRIQLTVLAISIAVAACANAQSAWTKIDLGATSAEWFTAAFGNLPDGRLVYGEHGNIYLQDSWGSSTFNSFSSAPSGMDPAFISVYNNSTAVIGSGGWGTSDVYSFTPNTVDSSFSLVANIQNYDAALRDEISFYIGGPSTGAENDRHGIRYMTIDGLINEVVIDDISAYSSGMALDAVGNLYVADNDDDKVFRFTSTQMQNAISGTTLSITDGELIYDFDMGLTGSLAIDAEGALWLAGWGGSGIYRYDPLTDRIDNFLPGAGNTNYKVGTFSDGAKSYVAYLNADGTATGSQLSYGYIDASVIPEPGTLMMVLAGITMLYARRLRSVWKEQHV